MKKYIKNKCSKCGNVNKYKNDINKILKQEGEIVINAVCSECGYKSEIFYKQITK